MWLKIELKIKNIKVLITSRNAKNVVKAYI